MDNQQPQWSKIQLDGSRRHQTDRKKYQKLYKNKHTVNQQGRLVNTKQYALAWGIKNRILYKQDLIKKTRDQNAPSLNFIMKTWRYFHKYYEDLCRNGMQPRPPRNDIERRKIISPVSGKVLKRILLTEDYNLARYVAKLNIGLYRKDYIEFRENNPSLKQMLPSASTVCKRFGSWKKFAYQVMKYNVDDTITRYVQESIKSGHWLFIRECEKIGIPIRTAMNVLRPRLFNVLCYRKMQMMGGDLSRK